MDDILPAASAATPTNHGPADRQGLIDAFVVDDSGRARPLHDGEASLALGTGYLWLHLNLDDCHPMVEQDLGLDPMVIRSLLATETRPRTRHLSHGVLINLRGVNLNDGCDPEDMLSVRCWLEPGRLITVRKRKSVAIEELREHYHQGIGHSGPAALLLDIVRGLMDRIDPVVDNLADSLDGHERRSQQNGEDQALCDEVAAMRHDAVIYRRYLSPMRDAITRLTGREDSMLSREQMIEAQEEADRATRVVEELDITIARASFITDQMTAARGERMNRNMMVLAVVSAVFLPLSFLTGLLGVNVAGMPGTEDPRAFGLVVSACIALGVALGLWFKKRRWF